MIQTTKHKCIDGIGGTQSAYRIDDSAVVHVSRLLRNAYADPVKAVLREYICNAIDAHKFLGIKDPVLLKLPSALDPTISFSDFGGGLSHEDFERLILGYGSSGEHKRSSNEQIGGFGIGCKSMFSVTDSFTYTVWFDGEERKYLCYLDDTDRGMSKMLYRRPNTERAGGMEVSAAVRPDQVQRFSERALMILPFLDYPVLVNGGAVVYEKFDDLKPTLSSLGQLLIAGDAPPVKWSYFQYSSIPIWASSGLSGSQFSRHISVRMGGVVYPIADNACKSETEDLPYGYYVFDAPIGSFEVAPSREALQQTRKVLRDIATIARAMEQALKAAVQPTIDLCEDPYKAHAQVDNIAGAFSFIKRDKFVWRGKEYKEQELFWISEADIKEHEVRFVTATMARKALRVIHSVPRRFYGAQGAVLSDNRGLRLLPDLTGVQSSQSNGIDLYLHKNEQGIDGWYGSPYTFSGNLLEGHLPEPKNSVQYLRKVKWAAFSRHHSERYLWVANKPEEFLKKYPWIKDRITDITDLRGETWLPPARAPRLRVPKVARSGPVEKRDPTLVAGLFIHSGKRASDISSEMWVQAKLAPASDQPVLCVTELDRFEVTGNHCDITAMGLTELLDLSVVMQKVLGYPIHGIKSGDYAFRVAKLRSAGYQVIPLAEAMVQLVHHLTTSKWVDTPLNLYSALWYRDAFNTRAYTTVSVGEVWKAAEKAKLTLGWDYNAFAARVGLVLRAISSLTQATRDAKPCSKLKDRVQKFWKLMEKKFPEMDQRVCGFARSAFMGMLYDRILTNRPLSSAVVSGSFGPCLIEVTAAKKTFVLDKAHAELLLGAEVIRLGAFEYIKPLLDMLGDPEVFAFVLGLVVRDTCGSSQIFGGVLGDNRPDNVWIVGAMNAVIGNK